MTKAGHRLIAAAREARLSLVRRAIKIANQQEIEKNWDMGQARTCLVCGEVFLTKKYLRMHRAKHRNKPEMTCEKTGTT